MLFFVPFFFIIYLFFAGFFSFFIFFESHFSKKPPKRPMPAPNWHEQTLIVPFSLMLAKFKPALFPRVPSFFPFDTKANSWCHKRHDWKKKKIYQPHIGTSRLLRETGFHYIFHTWSYQRARKSHETDSSCTLFSFFFFSLFWYLYIYIYYYCYKGGSSLAAVGSHFLTVPSIK